MIKLILFLKKLRIFYFLMDKIIVTNSGLSLPSVNLKRLKSFRCLEKLAKW